MTPHYAPHYAPRRLAGLFGAVDVRQPLGPLLIGERANATGSKQFRDMLRADDFDGMLQVLQSQEGAHVLDLSVAYTGRNEVLDLQNIVSRAARVLTAPLMLDSTNPDALEAALRRYPGRPVINSVHLEDGGKLLSRVAGLAKTWGAAIVALTIDEKGMALTRARKVEVALRLRETLRAAGLRDGDIFFDCLTFTIGSGDESLVNAASETLAAIAELRRRLPDCHRILGVSNVSFGLKPACRRVLNSVFLAEAVNAGLNAAIVDAAKILPLAEIAQAERELALNLIYNRGNGGEPLAALIRHFEESGEGREKQAAFLIKPAEALLAEKIMKGGGGLEDAIDALLERRSGEDIINTLLVPLMRKIGVLFGKGEMLLPFVLRAAEAMREAVDLIRPRLPQNTRNGRLKILLATVQGDVHDIGKNLVDIILSNNGYEVFNIGIKQSAEAVMAKAREYGVDAIGLSGLLVQSALVMRESLTQYAAAGMRVPVLLGGAALTRRFVAQECAPRYPGPVVYCKDPFDALNALEDLSAGRLRSTSLPAEAAGAAPSVDGDDGAPDVMPGETLPVEAPFTGRRIAADIRFTEAAARINKTLLFRGRWGFTKNAGNHAEYERLIRETAGPLYSKLIEQMERVEETDAGGLKAVYGYFPARREGGSLNVEHGGKTYRFGFTRGSSGRCLADFFRREDGPVCLPLFAVTLGQAAVDLVKAAYERDSYREYLFLHGLAAELTDALAETLQRRIAAELRLAEIAGKTGFSGMRYGFGYPACPNLELNAPLLELLGAAEIGLGLTENNMLDPEYATCGIIACHPDARYFSV